MAIVSQLYVILEQSLILNDIQQSLLPEHNGTGFVYQPM